MYGSQEVQDVGWPAQVLQEEWHSTHWLPTRTLIFGGHALIQLSWKKYGH